MRLLFLVFLASFLIGCATYKPVTDSYTGAIATVVDSGFADDDARTGQVFVLSEIDGNEIRTSIGASAQASYGGFGLKTHIVTRKVPAKPMKVKLIATQIGDTPVLTLFRQAAGSFLSVEGIVDFNPQPDGYYVVTGELNKEGSSVWIEDISTHQPVTRKIVHK